MTSAERIGIFVPVYHRGGTVRRSLASIIETCDCDAWGYAVRVVVADNGCDSETLAYLGGLCAERDNVHLISFGENKGKAKAINLASEQFGDYDWFVSCDSDILHLTPAWPALLAESFKRVGNAGMVSVSYAGTNNPMPQQPRRTNLGINGETIVYHYGGEVAGGCFLTSRAVWQSIRYVENGVYGGVDGLFRETVARRGLLCGYIDGVKAHHIDDREEYSEYDSWKQSVQANIMKWSPLAPSVELGNAKGFWD
jgi:glycosyltransferase involved in cell wall biosynthesis